MSKSQQQPMVNGEMPHSQTLDHFTSYPLIHDLLNLYTHNSLGAKSVSTINALYKNLVEPITPYFQTPYNYASPYLAKADELGDTSLKRVDDRFPSIKSTNLDSIKDTAFSVAHYPFAIAGKTKNYVYETYDDQYSKVSGESGVLKTGKTVVSTELQIAADALHVVGDWLGPKKDEIQAEYEKIKKNGVDEYEKAKKRGLDEYEKAKKKGVEQYDNARKAGQDGAVKARKTVDGQKENVSNAVNSN